MAERVTRMISGMLAVASTTLGKMRCFQVPRPVAGRIPRWTAKIMIRRMASQKLGSEFAVVGLLLLNPSLFWPTLVGASAGNSVGGAIRGWMGYGAERAYEHYAHRKPLEVRALRWLQRFGPKTCLLSWLPGVGDPICAVAGWLRFPFWPCVGYMAVGKFARYLTITAGLLWVFPGGLPF